MNKVEYKIVELKTELKFKEKQHKQERKYNYMWVVFLSLSAIYHTYTSNIPLIVINVVVLILFYILDKVNRLLHEHDIKITNTLIDFNLRSLDDWETK